MGGGGMDDGSGGGVGAGGGGDGGDGGEGGEGSGGGGGGGGGGADPMAGTHPSCFRRVRPIALPPQSLTLPLHDLLLPPSVEYVRKPIILLTYSV